MWKLLPRVFNPKEIKTITAWFIVSAIFQGITLSLMIPFLRTAFNHDPSATKWLIFVVTFGVLSVIIDTYASIRSYRVSVYETCDTVLEKISEKVLALPLGWFNAEREAQVVNATSKEINTLSHIASLVIPSLCNAFVVPLVMIVATVFVSPSLALIMTLTILPLYWSWRKMLRATTRANIVEDKAAAKTAGIVVEFAKLQAILRATGVTKNGWEPLHNTLAEENQAVLNGLSTKGKPGKAFNLILNFAFAIIVALGMSFVTGQHLDAVGYLAILAITSRMVMPLTKAAIISSEADNAKVTLNSIIEILESPVLPEPAPEDFKENSLATRDTTIELKNVSFSYEERRQILKNISLSAPQEAITALVGPSGVGKSTILRLVARFWDVNDGTVTIGGVNVKDLPSRRIMEESAMVFQDVYLFNTTIRENLRIAKPDATDEELELAAKRARLTSVIDQLPNGWDTEVGPGGMSLSGGERQRVAIARAFIKDAPILLLDEITSALDGENESAITDVIRELATGRTVLVVAHRLSTIWDADQVVFLQPTEDGAEIAQVGSPNELANQDGPFRDFVQASKDAARWHINAV